MDPNTMTLLLLPLMVVAFYFLLIRPQRKRAQQQQKLLSEMQPGERVVTHSGIFGTLVSIGDKQSVLQIAPGLEISVLKGAVARVVRPEDEDGLADLVDDELGADSVDGDPALQGTEAADGADAEFDAYRPSEPSSLDLPDQPAVDEHPTQPVATSPVPSVPPVQPASQPATEGSQAGIRDVTSTYFSRPESETGAEPETGRQTKDS